LQAIFVQQPEPEDVQLDALVSMKNRIERNSVDRAFIEDVQRQMAHIERGAEPEEVASRLQKAIERYNGAQLDKDHTGRGILGADAEHPAKDPLEGRH
jgi:hypothetical protein